LEQTDCPNIEISELRDWLKEAPTRWFTLAVWAFLISTGLSTLLSGSVAVSVWGEVPGQDGYPAYTVLSYLVIFASIASHLRSQPQLWRLLGAIIAMGVLVSTYTVLQHYHHDFLNLVEPTGGGTYRVTAMMGNAIFAATVMLMTIVITLAAAVMSFRMPKAGLVGLRNIATEWGISIGIAWAWGLVLAIQLLGITFTFSRGPWLGTFFGVSMFLGLTLLFLGWRFAGRSGAVVGMAAGWSIAILQWTGSISILTSNPIFRLGLVSQGWPRYMTKQIIPMRNTGTTWNI